MAESNKTGILALAQKQLARTKTKVLQNLGKAERTTDDVFNDSVFRIEKQQEVAHHLQKELKTYVQCLREMSHASKNLTNALAETYEAEWTKESTFKSQLQTFDLLWNDCLQTLHDNVNMPLVNYLNSFPALKAKIAKRGRKMVDYDNSRHNVEVLQAAKKKDDVKIQKAQEEMKEAKRIYDELNNELHTELPDFINSRVTFYASLLSSLFGAELVFHSEIGKVHATLNDVCQELGKDFEQFTYQPKRPLSKSPSLNSGENGFGDDTAVTGGSSATTPVTESSPAVSSRQETSQSSQATDTTKSPVPADISPTERNKDKTDASSKDHSTLDSNSKVDTSSDDDDDADEEKLTYWKTPSNEPVISPPTNTLFKVMATHRYQGEDLDELNFEPGEVIYVIPFDLEEEQDEGWLMGIKASDGIQGVFPENFTQKI